MFPKRPEIEEKIDSRMLPKSKSTMKSTKRSDISMLKVSFIRFIIVVMLASYCGYDLARELILAVNTVPTNPTTPIKTTEVTMDFNHFGKCSLKNFSLSRTDFTFLTKNQMRTANTKGMSKSWPIISIKTMAMANTSLFRSFILSHKISKSL